MNYKDIINKTECYYAHTDCTYNKKII